MEIDQFIIWMQIYMRRSGFTHYFFFLSFHIHRFSCWALCKDLLISPSLIVNILAGIMVPFKMEVTAKFLGCSPPVTYGWPLLATFACIFWEKMVLCPSFVLLLIQQLCKTLSPKDVMKTGEEMKTIYWMGINVQLLTWKSAITFSHLWSPGWRKSLIFVW